VQCAQAHHQNQAEVKKRRLEEQRPWSTVYPLKHYHNSDRFPEQMHSSLCGTCAAQSKSSNHQQTSWPNFWECGQVEAAPGHVHHDWKYLEEVEQKYKCGGWCQADKMFFNAGVAVDSCSLVAGQDLAQVAKASSVVQWLSFALFLFFTWSA